MAFVAETCRNAQPPDALTLEQLYDANIRTLNGLEDRRLLRAAPQSTYTMIANEWRAPLYQLDRTRLAMRPADYETRKKTGPPPTCTDADAKRNRGVG
jgi:hypothetical protein